jgi:DnaK suppressor protein
MNGLDPGQLALLEQALRKQRRDAAQALREGWHRGGEEQPAALENYLSDDFDPAEADALLAGDLARLGRQASALAGIDRALRRLADGSFGQCVQCGAPVGAARLLALPSAARCLACQEAEERTGGAGEARA